jgi:hypothetical protein
MALELLTHTKRRDFKNCRRYYLHRHLMHLAPRMQKRGRSRGTIFGNVLFDVLEAGEEGILRAADPPGEERTEPVGWDAALFWFIRDRVNEEIEELRDNGNLDAARLAELDVDEVKLRVMVFKYVERYGIDTRRELEFDLPLYNPATGRTSRAFRRGGKVDGVAKIASERVRIIEDKFVQQIQRVMIDRLPLDEQASEYVDAFMAVGWDAEVWYRHTRWPGINPKSPKEYKTKADYPGETMEEFEERLLEDVDERPEFYFDQQILYFPREHLDDYRAGRWGTAQEIIAARRVFRQNSSGEPGAVSSVLATTFPMNPSRCWEYGGCEFIPLCTKQEGAIDLYVEVEDNPELTRGKKEDEAVTSEYGGESA